MALAGFAAGVMLGSMDHRRFFVAVVLAAMFATSSCGTDSPSSEGTSTERSIAVAQNEAAATAVAKAAELMARFDEFDDRHIDIETYDATTGQEWLDYYNEEFIPAVEALEQALETMAERERELGAWVEASRAQAGLEPKLAAATLIYISGTVTIVAYTATFVGFRNRVVPLVEKVARKVQEGIDQGLNQAQAMAAASAAYIEAQDAIFLDLQVTVATEAFFSGLSTGASHCGKIALDAINIAGDAIGPAVTKLFGKDKSGSGGQRNLTQKQGDETEAIFFLGESEDGSFENVPLGDFDLLVFRDGYVRGNVQDVSLQTCAVTQEVPVQMATLDEFFEDDPTDPGPTPIAGLLGSCQIAGSLICDTWLGPELLRASVSETCTLGGGSWLSGQVCAESGSYGACRITQPGDSTRVLVFYASPEWTPGELAEQIADSEQDCIDLSGVVGTADWVSPYREAAP
jgi:hypothetical protein